MFTGKLSSLPPVTKSRDGEFRLIRPLVYVTEDITAAYARIARDSRGPLRLLAAYRHRPPIPARYLRGTRARLSAPERDMLSAMGNVDTGRLLDPRFLNVETGRAARVTSDSQLVVGANVRSMPRCPRQPHWSRNTSDPPTTTPITAFVLRKYAKTRVIGTTIEQLDRAEHHRASCHQALPGTDGSPIAKLRQPQDCRQEGCQAAFDNHARILPLVRHML